MLQQKPAQWRRSNHDRPALSEASPNIAPAKPPIPPTRQAKSKLKAIQFIAGQPEEAPTEDGEQGSEDKEMAQEDSEGMRVATVHKSSTFGASSAPKRGTEATTSSQSASKTPQLPHANTFPCTPGARLPLEDLIGNFDESARKPEPKEQSPEEQLGWIPNSSSSLLTPHRKRKRAKSSSPSCPTTSSQRQEASAFFVGNGTQGDKRSPEADPTADLWQRYGAGKDSVDGLKVPDFSHLIQASPRPLETPVKNAGLRRWASTGNDWPSSKNKRRRTDSRTSMSVWKGEQQTETCGKSKVATMVEKLQESLATQKLAQSVSKPAMSVEPPSSSSPLPEVGLESCGNVPSASPLQARQQQPVSRAAPSAVPRPPQPRLDTRKPVYISSDGPAPVDNNMRDVQLPDVVKPAPLHLQSKAPLPAYRRPAMARAPSNSGRQYPVKFTSEPAPVLPAVTEDFDEFGDAFDLSAEDLDELVSQKPLEQRSLHEIPPHPNPPPQQQSVLDQGDASVLPQTVIDVDDDEFGDDDLDEDTLAEAEFSATQAYRASHTSFNTVCVQSR